MIYKLYQTTFILMFVLLSTIGAEVARGQNIEPDTEKFLANQLRRAEMRESHQNEILTRNDGVINNARSASIASGELDPTFNADVKDEFSTVNEIVVQPDGKILVAGSFQSYNGTARGELVRLNTDGTLDAAFQPVINGFVQTFALQSDGKIIITGNFTQVNGAAAFSLARLNADGSRDASFNAGTGANSTVFSIAVQSNGKIVIGGSFMQVNGTARVRIAVLNSSGSLDTNFNAGTVNSTVFAVASLPDNKILLAGSFTSVGGITRNRFARINADGSPDTTFTSGIGLNSTAFDIALQTDGKILVGGYFTTALNQSRRAVARFNADGTLDTTFTPGTNLTNSGVYKVRVQPDGKIVVGGELNQTFSGPALISFTGTRRLNADGSLDTSYTTGTDADSQVSALAVQADGKILVGGYFNSFNGIASRNIVRLNANGSADGAFQSGSGFYALFSASIIKIVRQADGKILIGGYFTHVGSARRDNIARLNADGSLDASFNPGGGTFSFPNLENPVQAVTLQPDGKILVGGVFDRFNGVPRDATARLNTDGSLDGSFNSSGEFDFVVNDFAVQPDGKILQAGVFPIIKRVNANGTRDETFGEYPNNEVRRVVIQPDGKILVGGFFTAVGGQSRNRIARLNADGTPDPAFNPGGGADGTVYAIYLQPDGKILIGGSFNNFDGTARNHFARLNSDGTLDGAFDPILGSTAGIIFDIAVQSSGNIVVGGLIFNGDNTSRTGVARLTPDGSLDNSFNPVTDNSVLTLAIQPDNKILIGGYFERVNGVVKNGLARLFDNSAVPRTRFDFDGDGRSDISVFRPSNGYWYLNNSSIGFTYSGFGLNGDLIAPADYDGDGKTDLAVFRPSNGSWYLLRSTLGFTQIQFGASGDLPMPADFDGDGKSEIAIFRPSTGVWYQFSLETNQTNTIAFGLSGDVPAAGDYDGDGKADVAVFRPLNGTWYLNRSTAGFTAIQFGASGDKAVPSDYDGDGKTDLAVWRPSNGVWYLQQSAAGFNYAAFGINGDMPAPADYDGDGKTDLGIFRPSNGSWYLQRSTQGFTQIQFGASGDKPVPNAFVP